MKMGKKKAEKQKAGIEKSDNGVMFENGKLKLPEKTPAIDVNTKLDPKEQVLVGGHNLNGKKPKKVKKVKTDKKQKEKVEKIHWRTIGADTEGKGGVEFRMVGEIIREQTGMPNKQIHLQQMEFKSDKRKEYRLCYYMRKNSKDIFRFQRFTAFVPSQDFTAIMEEAHSKGWF